ncbi:intein-containing adenosylcobalamin-dependent ribonucleoside-diphosphate reductase [Deinococcus peraridilitoris]|uniref:Ribonucleoside-diphosphate reductase n=1 Tax=Deinococcus peraridilitoris (strain DSM 19664 / LMG 22246 / CIP 109416 / KR-200) TaxID=937777 RepID=L0A2M7_DEIPD|nr:intein-containing adenosylcobalamin-dependent ribonucleoside-diphosphate reductase [Deinococcus peraridilitoris]AFZ67452.1 ribonucleotide reductase, alpha subunit [Deinococcus peraridilitoris DSM 19664]
MTTSPARQTLANFDENAHHIAKRQYMQTGDGDLAGMFSRIAKWVASAETSDVREGWTRAFFDLMADKKFCPGGRVLAGAGTQHGNVLNCFVQGATEHDPSSFEGVMEVARKLALVTKVGGGNGVNLDVYRPRAKTSRADAGVRGWAYMSASHSDVTDFIEGMMRPPTQPDGEKQPTALRNWTRVVYGPAIPAELVALARQNGVSIVRELPEGVLTVQDDMGGIVDAAQTVAENAKFGLEPRIDLSAMRPEGAPIKGSGGTSSGPVSFLVEIFDNFLEWANRGGEDSGPVNTLRYVYSPVLRVVRQGGTRRGAGMATISIAHPDVLDFLTAKDLDREASEGDISTFNISILVDDQFWKVLQDGGLWPIEAQEVPGKYYLAPQGGKFTGTLPELPERAEDGARGVPLYTLKGGQTAFPAQWLWNEIAQHAWSTGEPGLIFVDRINELSALKDLGPRYQIRSTNPCFPADARIATGRGLVRIGELYETQEDLAVVSDLRSVGQGTGVTVRPGIPVFMTSRSAEVYRIVTEHGYEVRATANHQFLTPNGWVELKDLNRGETLLLQSGEGLWSDQYEFGEAVLVAQQEFIATAGSSGHSEVRSGRKDVRAKFADVPQRWSKELGQILGLIIGDGYVRADGIGISFSYSDYEELSPLVEQFRGWFKGNTQQHDASYQVKCGAVGAGYFRYLGLNPAKATEKRVPESIFRAPREVVVGFLQGLFTADGTVNRVDPKGSCTVRLSSSSLKLLKDVQLLLLNFGIAGRIRHRRCASLRPLPDGRGGLAEYDCKDNYELLIDKANRDLFVSKIGFLTNAKRSKVEEFITAKKRKSNRETFETTIAQIVLDGIEPVYDTTVYETHSLIANGIIAHNCGEIPLTVGEPCDLGAINLAAYVKGSSFDFAEFREDVRTTVRFLDDVLDVNVFALDDNRNASHDLRRLGLGVMGLADCLIKMGLRYDSEAGRDAIYEIMSTLRDEAIKESERLGTERGVYPVYERHAGKIPHAPRRNVAVLTVAPTGTTSMLMGVSSGIEPVFSPFIWRKIGSEYRALLHPLFVELLETYPPAANMAVQDERGEEKWDWDKVTDAVSGNHGSVQGLEFIPQALRAVFVCAHDIKPVDHVRMQGVVQRAFDAEGYAANSLSKTINLPNEATVQDVQDAYNEAFRTGCKGITVYRDGSRQFQVLSTSKSKKKAEHTEEAAAEVMGEAGGTPGSETPKPEVRMDAKPQVPAFKPGKPVYERPARLSGITDMVKLTDPTSGHRRSFLVTVNHLHGKPVEVMVISGRAGDEANADSEALGRVVSIALQYGVPAEALIKTMRGINGGLYGSYNGRLVGSKADLIAVALETFRSGEVSLPPLAGGSGELPDVPLLNAEGISAESAAKGQKCPVCDTNALVQEEGCLKCQACGYSKCG